jgi:hypothetical protein
MEQKSGLGESGTKSRRCTFLSIFCSSLREISFTALRPVDQVDATGDVDQQTKPRQDFLDTYLTYLLD